MPTRWEWSPRDAGQRDFPRGKSRVGRGLSARKVPGRGGRVTIVETSVDMSTSLGAVSIPSPVLTASGCSAFGRELEPFVDLTAIGAVVTKSVQLRPRSGRPTPRMAETPSGMLNSIGLQGPGIDGLLADDLPWLAERGVRAFVSIAGTRVEDFAELAARLRGVPGVLGPRGQHQLPERREPRRGVRLRPGGRLGRRRRRPRRRRSGPAGLRQAQPGRHRHRERGPGGHATPGPTGCR